jgi:hypothetical protein
MECLSQGLSKERFIKEPLEANLKNSAKEAKLIVAVQSPTEQAIRCSIPYLAELSGITQHFSSSTLLLIF